MKQKGFTLLELVLSIALFAILAGATAAVYYGFQVRNDLQNATALFAQSARKAQLKAQAMESDASWGVAVQPQSITIFKGASFASRDASFDEVFEISLAVAPSGKQEFIFDKMTGSIQEPGTLTLATANSAQDILINEKGIVFY